MSASTFHPAKSSWTQEFGRAWSDFWFRPCDPTLVSLLRIGVGLVALFHLASYRGDLVRWFGADGLLPVACFYERLIYGVWHRYGCRGDFGGQALWFELANNYRIFGYCSCWNWYFFGWGFP